MIKINYLNRAILLHWREREMVKNNFEKEIKIKCLEEDTTQAEIAEKAGTTGSYVSRLINKNDGIINKTFVRLLEELGYDVELTYVKKEA